MSLLMEALRKAEEAKRKGQSPHAEDTQPEGEATPFSLVPVERDTRLDAQASTRGPAPQESDGDAASAAPDTAGHDEELHSYLHDETISEPPAETTARKRVRVNPANRQSEAQLAAASIFAAKQQAPAKSPYLKPVLWSLLVALPLIGGGAWYLQQSRNSSGILLNPDLASVDLAGRTLDTSIPAPPADANTAGAGQAPTGASTPDTGAATGAEVTVASTEPQEPAVPEEPALTETREPAATPALASTPPDPATDAPPAAPEAQATAAAQPDQPGADATASNVAAPATTRLQVSRSREPASVNSTLQSAWNTLQAGDSTTAARLYQEALRELPNNRDALLGLAVIYTRDGRLDEARRLYAQALTLNPQDPLARTGLLQTMTGSGSEIERELLSLRDSFPELAPIHFALGNLYAARQSWSDAQGAYFNALVFANRAGNGPVSPDYAFNLAVSLEQLQQPRAALDYYRQARTLAEERAPGFDPALLRSRLAFLEQNLP